MAAPAPSSGPGIRFRKTRTTRPTMNGVAPWRSRAAPPALVTITAHDAPVAAVVQATKTGMLFVLNRETGRPIFPVEERPVPSSDIPGEQAAGTQPFTAVTPPLSPHRFSADSIWGTTDADRAACHAAIDGLRNEGVFTPRRTPGTMMLPSNSGGAVWGGVPVDP